MRVAAAVADDAVSAGGIWPSTDAAFSVVKLGNCVAGGLALKFTHI